MTPGAGSAAVDWRILRPEARRKARPSDAPPLAHSPCTPRPARVPSPHVRNPTRTERAVTPPPLRIPRRLPLPALLLVLLLAAVPGALAAQEARAAAGVVSGTIVDAGTALPLADAAVTLEPRESGALPETPRGGGVLRGAWTARTDSTGRYRFAGVAEGEYRLRVQRIGYRPSTVELSIRGPAESRVSLGLVVQPVALEPVTAEALPPEAAPNPFGTRAAEEDDGGAARLEAELLRQRTFLAPDVRVVTGADVQEGVTLAETDLFRALQRLPGVSARDDYSADLWTRGAPWDHTRVYFDGIPLYNPVHTQGLFSGVSPDAAGAVFFHPGVQPLSSPGGAAATLEVRSRRGGADRRLGGVAEASLASARLAMDGSSANGRHAWMVAGRSSYPGTFLERIERRTREQDVWATSSFADLAGRYDLRLGARGALEASALWQRDEVSDGPDVEWAGGDRPRWGNLAARATLLFPLGEALRARVTAGMSRFGARVDRREDEVSKETDLFAWPVLFAATSHVGYAVAEARVEPAAEGAAPPAWQAGAGVARHRTEYDGPPAYPVDERLPPLTVRRDGGLSYAFLWGEGRWRPARRVSVEGGMRLEAGGTVPSGGSLRWAPRAAVRWQAGPMVSLSAAAGRTWQYVQAGPELDEQAITQHLWLSAGGEVPALRSDVATVGAEGWLGGGWLGSLAAYERRSSGVAVLDPAPGPVIGREGMVVGSMRAEGVELSLRKLTGRWTASAAYSWGVSTTRAGGYRYASAADQQHTLDLSARTRLPWGLGAGAAFTAASGAAYNRFYGGIAICSRVAGTCRWEELPRADLPGTLRAPGYASLDLLLDWSRAFGRWRAGAYLQLHNALDRRNTARYNHSVLYPRCGFGKPVEGQPGCTEDLWSLGLPRMPMLGARVSF